MTEIIIPQQLHNPNFRFVKLKGKVPIEEEWQTKNNYAYNNTELKVWIMQGNNYGVCGGFGGLIHVDSDTKELNEAMKTLQETFTVKTGNPDPNRFHYYFICSDCKESFVISKNKIHYGEVQSVGRQVVGVGSTHPSGRLYLIVDESEIVEINFQKLKETLIKANLLPKDKFEPKVIMPLTTTKTIPKYVKDLIKNGVEEGLRNQKTWVIVLELYNLGYDSEIILEKAMEFNRNCKPPRDEIEVKNHIRQLLSNPKYLQKAISVEEVEKIGYGMEIKAEPIKKFNPESIKEMDLKELQDILGLTIKHDNTNKIITFLTMLNTFTEDSQMNISFRSISATGKSYIPIEESQLFPKEDVKSIAYASPTSFWHDNSEWDEVEQVLKMDMERKIYIFIDQPHDMLLQRLRPVLSHDKKELDIKITDRREKHGLRTKTVRIRGYPTVIFCSGSLKMDEQESTRSFLLSPETTQEKIKESIELKIKKDSNTMQFLDWINSDKRRLLLKERIEQIKNAKINYVVLDEEKIKKRFFENRKFLKPRDTRDIGRLDNLIKGLTLFNLWYRKKDDKGNLIASVKDIEDGFKIWEDIAFSQELGIPPYIYRLWKEVIEPLTKENNSGTNRKMIVVRHYQKYGRSIADWQLRQEIIPSLESVGLIYQEPNPVDKREMLIHSSIIDTHSDTHCIISNIEKKDDSLDNYSELESGVDIVSGGVV